MCREKVQFQVEFSFIETSLEYANIFNVFFEVCNFKDYIYDLFACLF
jgi:hypothetical protein